MEWQQRHQVRLKWDRGFYFPNNPVLRHEFNQHNLLKVYQFMKYNLELTSQVTQMRTHYCCRDADRLKKEKYRREKKRIRVTAVLSKDAPWSLPRWLLIHPAQIRRAVPRHYNPTPIHPFRKAVSGISRQQTNKCPFLNKGIETIKDKSTYFYPANSR